MGGWGGGQVSVLVLPGLCERLSRGAQAGTKRAQCWQAYMLDGKSGAVGREVSPTLEGSLQGSDPTWLPAVQRLRSWYLEERCTGLYTGLSEDLGLFGLPCLSVPIV